MSDPIRFLTSLGQALSATGLYTAGHPARERAVDAAYLQLEALQKLDPAPNFSFLEDDVLYRQQAIRDFKAWDWARRLARAGVQRVEFDKEVTRDELAEFLGEVHRKVSTGVPDDTSDARQMREKQAIRFGLVSIRGASLDISVEVAESSTIAYTLDDEIETVNWIHAEVESTDALPLAEANAVVRSLSLAMHSQSRMLMPLLQLKTYDQYTTTHATNVSVLAMALAEYIGLAPRDVREFGVAGLLHDLGKVRVPKEILIKPGALTAQEIAVLRRAPGGRREAHHRPGKEPRLGGHSCLRASHHDQRTGLPALPLRSGKPISPVGWCTSATFSTRCARRGPTVMPGPPKWRWPTSKNGPGPTSISRWRTHSPG